MESPPVKASLRGIRFVKGHGAENDFIVIGDPDGERDLTAAEVRWLCDRHAGIGADGVIRAVRTRAMPGQAELLVATPEAEWFMDYRNADGSVAQMCGNGVRVLVDYLVDKGLVGLLPAGEWNNFSPADVAIATRGGVKRVRALGDHAYTVEMGEWSFPRSALGLLDVTVEVGGLDGTREGMSVLVPNPHVVVPVAADELARIDLTHPPRLIPTPDDGANVEFVVLPPAADAERRISMRVWERGVGETRCCGTGICAAVIAAQRIAGRLGAPGVWTVSVPGGTLTAEVVGGILHLTGPTALSASGTVL